MLKGKWEKSKWGNRKDGRLVGRRGVSGEGRGNRQIAGVMIAIKEKGEDGQSDKEESGKN